MRTALIYNFLIEANLMAAIAILLMIPVRMFGRARLGSRVICAAWLLVAIRLLCPLALPNPIIHEIRSVFAPDAAIRPIAGQVKVRVYDALDMAFDHARHAGVGGAMEENLQDLRESAYNGMLSIRLMNLYAAGAAAVTGWFVYCNRRFQKQLRTDRIEQISGRVQDQYLALCRELGIRKPVPVWFVDPLPSACLVGCFRPYIALPLTAKPNEIENVLRHELCHYRARDHWWGLVRLCCCALHWFNPLVWAAARMSCTDSELACDERVIRSMNEEQRRDYASVLVLAAARRDLPGVSVMSTGMSMTGRRLKKRVLSIVQNPQNRKWLALGFLVAAGIALIGAFCTAEMPVIGKLPSTERMSYTAESAAIPSVELDSEKEQQLIKAAQTFWRNEALQADVHDDLSWDVQAYLTHTEVHAYDPEWGEALIVAFAPDGRILYMNNRRSGDRDALSCDDGMSRQLIRELDAAKEYALAVLEAMEPGLVEKMGELDPSNGCTKAGQQYFHRFFAYEGEGDERRMSYVFNVQLYPEVRLTQYENLLEMDENASDRLEPGNG